MNNLDLLIPQAPSEPTDVWRWATVTAVDPLRIRLDGETEPLDTTPDNTIGPVTVGQRVWTQTTGRRLLVVGASGGPATAPAGSTEPVGTVKVFAGSAAPAGYLLCDGGTFSSVDYPELAAVLGDTYGVHSGTSYRLPDARGRTIVGKSADTEFDTLGKTGGEKAVTLTTAQIPPHTHPATSGNKSVGADMSLTDRTSAASAGSSVAVDAGVSGVDVIIAGSSHNHTVTVSANTGGGGSHNNLQPFITMNYIICAR